MFRKIITLVACGLLPLWLCQCVTTTQQAAAKNPPITVEGMMFYPDDANQTYIIPAGAEIVGAGGSNCRYIVESGGKLSAHAGTENTYKIKNGGFFKGFAHPATKCQVEYQAGAKIEKQHAGKGVTFTLAP